MKKIQLKFYQRHEKRPNAAAFSVFTLNKYTRFALEYGPSQKIWTVDNKTGHIFNALLIDAWDGSFTYVVLRYENNGEIRYYDGTSDIVAYTTFIDALCASNKVKQNLRSIAHNLKQYYNNVSSDADLNSKEYFMVAINGDKVWIEHHDGNYYINGHIVPKNAYSDAHSVFVHGGRPIDIINSIRDIYNEYTKIEN